MTAPKRLTLQGRRTANAIARSLRDAGYFQRLCRAAKMPEPVLEYQCIPDRKFRADLCWPAHRLCLEIEGGTWIGGRFNYAKATLHAVHGWRILYTTPADLLKGETLALVRDALNWGREG